MSVSLRIRRGQGIIEAARGAFKLESGRMARQADAAVLVHFGDTRVLTTVTRGETEDLGYFPLIVDYEEKFYAGGKIPGGFLKREGKPSDEAVLNARLIDRPIRPLFPEGYQEKVHIVATVLSADGDHPPEIAALLGASVALMLSHAPFEGPIAGVRLARTDGRFIVNPTEAEREEAEMDVVIAGTKDAVTMVEGILKEVPEDVVVESITVAHGAIKELIALQEDLLAQASPEKVELPPPEDTSALEARLAELVGDRLEAMRQPLSKLEREALVQGIGEEAIAQLLQERGADLDEEEREALEQKAAQLFEELVKRFVRQTTLARRVRFDGRAPEELRPVHCEVGLLPRVHGSSLFVRGETQSLGTCTLGTTRKDEQIIDLMLQEGRKRFMLHYNFPPYSVGETGRLGPPKRREIGHGRLAENALRAVIPSEEEFPYSIRLVSEILESNGSSSMATVCSGTLALMDAGVPIKRPVAGIAMGLIEEGGDYLILTDIAGYEDHYGDMDFKVAGTRSGLTAFQLDVKVSGISPEVLRQALQQARRARLQILDIMEQTLPRPRPDLSPYAPRLTLLKIDPEKIGAVIGPGGKVIRAIQSETDTEIDIEEDGTVKVSGTNPQGLQAALQRIEELTEELEPGKRYTGKVVRIERYGAFVEFKGGLKGMIHISDLADGYVKRVEDVVKLGEEITVEVTGIDEMGRPDLKRVSEREPVRVGDVFPAVVKTVKDYGAFVRTDNGLEGLIHVSALSDRYVKRVEDVVRVGDRVQVELIKIDEEKGRYSFKLVDKPHSNGNGQNQ